MNVKILGLDKALKRLSKIPQKLDDGTKEAITKTVYKVSGSATRRAPVKSGTLRRSITQFAKNERVQKSGGKWIGKVGTNVHYAPHQEYGTKRGIRPKYFFKTSVQEGKDYLHDLLIKAMKNAIM